MIATEAAISNPYPGLRSFEADESDLFFGREAQTDELLDHLGHSRFVAVTGTSGSGKSSLVRAGLLPGLSGGRLAGAGSHWRIAVLRPGGDPTSALASALVSALYPDRGDDPFVRNMLAITLRRSSYGIVEAARQARLGPYENLLIVVDQFEELFRFRQARGDAGDQAAAFVHLFLEAIRQTEIPIHVLITMRSDFLGDCAEFRDLPQAINDGLYLIPRMTRNEVRIAITAPAAVHGAELTPRLVQELLNNINDDPDQLPVLQHALMRTWNRWRNMPGHLNAIDLEDYYAIGGMADGLSRHANEAWEELPGEPGSLDRELARRIFQCLTEKGPDNREVRRPTRLRDVCRIIEADPEAVRGILEVFRREERVFLMPPPHTSLDGNTVIDISHESLIRKWDKLRGWVEEEAQAAAMYRRIAEAASLDQRGEAGLWRNPQLQLALEWRSKIKPAEAWAERYAPGFEIAMTFLDRSALEQGTEIKEKEEVRRKEARALRIQRVHKKLYGLMMVTVAVAAVFASLLMDNRKLLRETVARRLATQAALLNTQTDAAVEQSLLLAAESMRRTPSLQNDEVLRLGLALLPREIARLGHRGEVNQVAFSRDGGCVATASADGYVRVMEARSGRVIWQFDHGSEVTTLVFSADARYLATGSGDGGARVFEAATGKPVSLVKHDGRVFEIAFSPNSKYVATASEHGMARIMEAATAREVAHFAHEGDVNTVAYSPDGRRVATGSDDYTVRVTDAATGRQLWSFKDLGEVHRVTFSRDGRLVAAAIGYRAPHSKTESGLVRVLKAADGKPVFRALQQGRVIAVAFSPDGESIATGSLDKTVRLFHLETGGELWRVLLQESVRAIAFSPDGHHLATGSADKTARVIEVATGKEITRLPHQGWVNSVAFSPDGERVATASLDKTARIMEATSSKELVHLTAQNEIYSAAFSADQRYIATADSGGEAVVSEIATGKTVVVIKHHAAVYALAFSRDGKHLVTGSADNTAQCVDLSTGHSIWVMPHNGNVYAVAFSPDGRLVVTGGEDKKVRVVEALTGRQIAGISQPSKVVSLAVGLAGQIAIGGADGSLRILDITGRELLPPLLHEEQVSVVAFSPADGEYLATASGNTLRVIDSATGKQIARRSYREWINAVAFSGDGRLLAAGGADGTVRVMESATGHEISGLSHDVKVYDLAFSPVGQFLSVAAGDAVYRDLLRPKELVDEACSRLTRNLTLDEWRAFIPEEHRYRKTCPDLTGAK